MNTTLTIDVPMCPPREASPNARVHRMARHRWGTAARDTAYLAAQRDLAADPAGADALRAADRIAVRLRIEWAAGRKRMDSDNAIASCKAILDGVARALGIDDRRFAVVGVEQETTRHAGKTDVVLEAEA